MSERWTPHATVATIVFHDGRFLMVDEICGGEAVLNQPAGHIEPGETVLAAAERETLEETGRKVTPEKLLGLYIYNADNGVTYHRYCLIASADEEVAGAELDDGIIGPVWMTIEELRSCSRLRSPMVLTCAEDYLAGRQYPLDIITEHA